MLYYLVVVKTFPPTLSVIHSVHGVVPEDTFLVWPLTDVLSSLSWTGGTAVGFNGAVNTQTLTSTSVYYTVADPRDPAPSPSINLSLLHVWSYM